MINERDRHISRRILARSLPFCNAPSCAILRFSATGNDDERDGGIRNRGRWYLADLLRADDAIAEPPRKSRIVWPDRTAAMLPVAAEASPVGSAATTPHQIVRAIRATQ